MSLRIPVCHKILATGFGRRTDDKGGIHNRNLDANIKPLHLTAQEKKDLVALKALSGEGWQHIGMPDEFPR